MQAYGTYTDKDIDDYKVALPAFCRSKRALTAFLWFTFIAWLASFVSCFSLTPVGLWLSCPLALTVYHNPKLAERAFLGEHTAFYPS